MKTLVSVIIPAAGLSKRMNLANAYNSGLEGFRRRKPFILIGNRPILSYTLDIFRHIDAVKEIILVVNKEDSRLAKRYFSRTATKIITGQATRNGSVYNGIKALNNYSNIILIHDGVRPFVSG